MRLPCPAKHAWAPRHVARSRPYSAWASLPSPSPSLCTIRVRSGQVKVASTPKRLLHLSDGHRCEVGHASPTIYALSTPPGRAAIAVLRISGPACGHVSSLGSPNDRSDVTRADLSFLVSRPCGAQASTGRCAGVVPAQSTREQGYAAGRWSLGLVLPSAEERHGRRGLGAAHTRRACHRHRRAGRYLAVRLARAGDPICRARRVHPSSLSQRPPRSDPGRGDG